MLAEIWSRGIILLFAGGVKMVMMFAPCGDGSPASFSMFNFAMLLFRPYVIYIQCYESIMVFAPGGDGGCPHQRVSVIMCTTVFLFLLCLL